MNAVTHLGICSSGGRGQSLLSTTPFDSRNEQSERKSWSAAQRLLREWRAVRPGELLEIVPLRRRSYDGWEAARS